jgi:two-component system KDP operon response regulator KdpE
MNILLLDDDPQLLDAVAVGFALQWPDCAVIGVPDGAAGLKAFYEQDPDLIVLNVSLAGVNGMDLLQRIRRISDIPVVVLTARGREIEEIRALELGADDYIVKPVSVLALLARIKAVLRRCELPAPIRPASVLDVGDLVIDFANFTVVARGEPVTLGPIEYQLLYHLVRNADHPVPHAALLNRVWGPDYGATLNHLRVSIARLRARIERDPHRPEWIQTEPGIGYRFVRPTDAT